MSVVVSAPILGKHSAPPLPIRWLHRGEELLVSALMSAMILFPLAEIVLRKFFRTGLPNNSILVQHLVLIVSMAGAAIAAREDNLIALSTLDRTLPRRLNQGARIFSGAFSTCVSFLLAYASYQFLVTEKEAEKVLLNGFPTWVVELAFPIGFVFMGLRVAMKSAPTWAGRFASLILAFLFCALPLVVHPGWPQNLALAVLVLAGLLGAPAFVILAGAALILFWKIDQPIASIPIAHYALVVNPALPTLPLFTLAGYLLAEGKAPQRMIRVFDTLFGSFRGGPALVTVLVCAFFTSFTGASGVTILALGGLLMPLLKQADYSDRDALGLVTGTGSIGMLLPPCLPLILYAVIARIPIEQLFLGGIIPGTILVLATAAWGMWKAKGANRRQPASLREKLTAINDAKWELALPLVAFIALFSGMATPVEAAAVTALFALVSQVCIHRDLNIRRDVPRVMSDCGALVGSVLLILGVALGFTNYLVDAEVTERTMTWVTGHIHSQWLFLFALNIFMWLIGCLMDIYSAIVIQVPLLITLGAAYSVDPVHLGIIFLANLELGYLTPPVGLNLILSSTRFRKPIGEVLRSVLPIAAVFFLVVMLITYVPPLTTWLARWGAR